MNKKINKIIRYILIVILAGFSYSFFFTSYETIKVNSMIKEFKSRGILDETVELTLTGPEGPIKAYRNFFIVPRGTYEKDGLNVLDEENKGQLGAKGDIFVTRQSPFPKIPVFHQFMSYYFGGHAAIYNGKGFIEATGYPEKGESLLKLMFMRGKNSDHGYSPVASINNNYYWNEYNRYNDEYLGYYRTEYIGLRIKDADTDLIDKFVEKAEEKVEEKRLYNFLFFLNMRYKYYCTDLVSRSYEEAYNIVRENKENYKSKGYAKKMNDDGFITSVNDLILSKDTYISFYVEIIEENGVHYQNYYYLENIK